MGNKKKKKEVEPDANPLGAVIPPLVQPLEVNPQEETKTEEVQTSLVGGRPDDRRPTR